MKFKKTFLIICIILCLFTMTGLSASDVDDGAIDSADEIELSKIADDLKATEENQILNEKDNGTFKALDDKISNAAEGSTVKLENDYAYEGTEYPDGIVIFKSNIIIDGQGHTIDAQKQTRIFYVMAENVTVKNLTFINGNNNDVGGAILWDSGSNGGCVCDCKFVNNTAQGYDDCYGGAIYWKGSNGCVSGCSFINNTAQGDMEYGGAIFWFANDVGYISLCSFMNNAAEKGSAICSMHWLGVSVDSCIYKTDSDNNFNTQDFAPNLTVDNFTSFYKSGERLTFDLTTNRSAPITDANITIEIYKNNTLFGNYHCLSGEGWTVDLPIGSYNAVYKTEFAGLAPVNGTIEIKIPTQITSNDVTAVYNENNYLVIVLKDYQGNPIMEAEISIDLNGIKTLKTDSNGQVKVNVGNLIPKTYNVKITFNGKDDYYKSQATVKVTVKKATPKIKAKKKTFKKSKKIKKYKVTLKDNARKPIKNVKLTIKIGKKTYKAKTNNNGKATFKIKKLTKKAKYKAVVTFKGNACYNKATKKVKITVK